MQSWKKYKIWNIEFSYLALKASKVNETWAWKVSCFFAIDTEEEVQGESGDHGGKELHTEKDKYSKRGKEWRKTETFTILIINIALSLKKKWLYGRGYTLDLLSSMSASGSRKKLPPPERKELHLSTTERKINSWLVTKILYHHLQAPKLALKKKNKKIMTQFSAAD